MAAIRVVDPDEPFEFTDKPDRLPWTYAIASCFLWFVLVVSSIGFGAGVFRLGRDLAMRPNEPETALEFDKKTSWMGWWFLQAGWAGVGLIGLDVAKNLRLATTGLRN